MLDIVKVSESVPIFKALVLDFLCFPKIEPLVSLPLEFPVIFVIKWFDHLMFPANGDLKLARRRCSAITSKKVAPVLSAVLALSILVGAKNLYRGKRGVLPQPIGDEFRRPFLEGVFEPTLVSFAGIKKEDVSRNGIDEPDEFARRYRSFAEHIVVQDAEAGNDVVA